MSYTALYRKLRPWDFKGIVGQEHIVKTLMNQLTTGRITHAYLFCGTRGTGKTTTAKVFSKGVNCQSPKGGEPCNQCESCAAVNENRSLNVIEIDAASNNGVDNIRDIREEVKYPPAQGRYKVYIVDEVHMLSSGAFNALLKTLEEPPPHAIFILATTDPQKIPPTIHSRCQRFDFRRISAEVMTEALRGYMKDENVEIDEEAIRHVAAISDGAMRDAISILDQCISFYYNEKITLDMVLEATGAVDPSVFFLLCDALAAGDSSLCMEVIDDFVKNGRDVSQFLTDFLGHLRNLLVSLPSHGSKSTVDLSAENREALLSQAKKFSPELVMGYIRIFSELLNSMRYAANARMLLEVQCIRICNPVTSSAAGVPVDAMKRLDEIENMIKKGAFQQAFSPGPGQQGESENKPEAPSLKEKAVPEDIQKVISQWEGFVKSFPPAEAGFLSSSKPAYMDGDALYIVCESMGHVTYLRRKEDLIKQKLSDEYGRHFQLKIEFKEIYNQSHKKLYGKADSFDYKAMLEDLSRKVDFKIDEI